MKKQHLNHKGLTLNKSVISNLASKVVKGGLAPNTASCLADANTICYTANCGTNDCGTNDCGTNTCPPQTVDCPRTISCQPVGIC